MTAALFRTRSVVDPMRHRNEVHTFSWQTQYIHAGTTFRVVEVEGDEILPGIRSKSRVKMTCINDPVVSAFDDEYPALVRALDLVPLNNQTACEFLYALGATVDSNDVHRVLNALLRDKYIKHDHLVNIWSSLDTTK